MARVQRASKARKRAPSSTSFRCRAILALQGRGRLQVEVTLKRSFKQDEEDAVVTEGAQNTQPVHTTFKLDILTTPLKSIRGTGCPLTMIMPLWSLMIDETLRLDEGQDQ